MIVKLLVSVALLANPNFGLALRVTVTDDAAADSGTSPERINVFESYEAWCFWHYRNRYVSFSRVGEGRADIE